MVCSTSPDRLISAMSSRTATITTTPSAHRRPVLSPSPHIPIGGYPQTDMHNTVLRRVFRHRHYRADAAPATFT